jgi:ADP-heptose:LPS heptosyltransferase
MVFSRIQLAPNCLGSFTKRMKSLVKEATKDVLYRAVDVFVKPKQQIQPKTLLLIRLDAIGDYVLFQNYVELIKASDKYRGYCITLLGNDIWKEFEERRSASEIDNYIWLNRKKFFRNIFYRYSILKTITSNGYEVVIQPTFSREYRVGDAIVKLVSALHKIGHAGDFGNSTPSQKRRSDQYYTKLVSGTKNVLYEFDRNKEFFQEILESPLSEQIRPSLPKYSKKDCSPHARKKYVILFIGANTRNRHWATQKYALLAMHLKQSSRYKDHDIIISGSAAEVDAGRELASKCCVPLINMVGKTTLVELAELIAHSKLLVTNETCAHHIGIATNCCLVIVLYAGNHFGRFVPLVPHDNTYRVILHPEIRKAPEAYRVKSNKAGYFSTLDINEITVSEVFNEIVEH